MDKTSSAPTPTPAATDPLTEVEQVLERGFCAVHGQLSENFSTLFQIAATTTGVTNLLVEKGVISGEEVLMAVSQAGKHLAESFGRSLQFQMYKGTEDKRTVQGQPIDCEARLPLCKAACCALEVEMSAQDVEEGRLRIELGQPYLLRRSDDGHCCHLDRATGGCGAYDDRPVVCRNFSCINDARIWHDFEARVPNEEGIQQILTRGRAGRLRVMVERPRTEKPLPID